MKRDCRFFIIPHLPAALPDWQINFVVPPVTTMSPFLQAAFNFNAVVFVTGNFYRHKGYMVIFYYPYLRSCFQFGQIADFGRVTISDVPPVKLTFGRHAELCLQRHIINAYFYLVCAGGRVCHRRNFPYMPFGSNVLQRPEIYNCALAGVN